MSASDRLREALETSVAPTGTASEEPLRNLGGIHEEYLAEEAREARRDLAGRSLLSELDAMASSGDRRIGSAVTSVLGAVRPSHQDVAARSAARLLDPPVFEVESDFLDDRQGAAGVRRFARADARDKTLEVAAAVGGFGGHRWPSSDTFLLGYNEATAFLGGTLTLSSPRPGRVPRHGAVAVLTLALDVTVEQVLNGTATPTNGMSLLFPLRGDGQLPLRGSAVGWARLGLTVHGGARSARTVREVASAWENRDGSDHHDGAPAGQVTLSHTMAVDSAVSTLAVFVDLRCMVMAEESADPLRSAFCVLECRDKPISEINGIYVPPARVRISGFSARLHDFPVLSNTSEA